MDAKTLKSKLIEGNETDDNKQLKEMLGRLDWKIIGTQYPVDEQHGIATIEHAQYPNRHFVNANCSKGCDGMEVSFGDHEHTTIQGQLLVPATVIEPRGIHAMHYRQRYHRVQNANDRPIP